MRHISLRAQVFLSILSVALLTAVGVGYAAHAALAAAFDRYLASLPQGMPMHRMPGRGRMMLGAAEQAFLASVDASVLLTTGIAVLAAAVVALALAEYLARPLRELEAAAGRLAEGDLAHRVDVKGSEEIVALGDAFNSMAGSLERAEELRRRMTADVAHELRNPLAAARAQAEALADGIVPAEPERVASIVEDLQHLSSLIDDLQELAVAEAGGLRYEMHPVDLGKVACSEAERARALLAEGVVLSTECAEGVLVNADERRLAQVMRNLLSNAARHTREGSITVTVARNGDEAVATVADTGEGMRPEDAASVFERFYRADSARAADTGGSGLGLAIARAIVRDHGGDVFVDSELGRGTRIGFRLPLLKEGAAR